jgi:hypothetical protein
MEADANTATLSRLGKNAKGSVVENLEYNA